MEKCDHLIQYLLYICSRMVWVWWNLLDGVAFNTVIFGRRVFISGKLTLLQMYLETSLEIVSL